MWPGVEPSEDGTEDNGESSSEFTGGDAGGGNTSLGWTRLTTGVFLRVGIGTRLSSSGEELIDLGISTRILALGV
jgi:hypothetical protein